MSKLECGQLHSELFGRRHSTLQSHGLFALAKHLLKSDNALYVCLSHPYNTLLVAALMVIWSQPCLTFANQESRRITYPRAINHLSADHGQARRLSIM